jgi:hypothetical protein
MIYKLASKLVGYYITLYKETMPFHNESMSNQEHALKICEQIKEEVNKHYNRNKT